MRYGLAAFLLIYLPFLGALVAGSTCSLVLDYLFRENRNANSLRLSRELCESGAANAGFWLPACLLPFPVLAVLCQRALPAPGSLPWLPWFIAFGALFAGCVLLYLHASASRRAAEPSARQVPVGRAGVLAILAASFLLFVLVGTLFNPDKLSLVRKNPVYLLSWQSVAGFLRFLAMSFGLAGGILLLFFSRPKTRIEPRDPDYDNYVRSVGSRLASGGALTFAPLAVLALISLPPTGLSTEVFAAAVASLILALSVALVPRLFEGIPSGRAGGSISLLSFLMFFAVVAGDQAAVANAFLGKEAPRKPPVPAESAEGRKQGPAEPAVEKGRTVFQNVCRACHLLDGRLVGPPLKEVLPKYRGNLESLKRFIREPVKVNSDYPLMPHLGLGEEEVDAVARYLFASGGMEAPAERPRAEMPPEEKGKAVFESVCSTCHRIDVRLVGPPFKDVIPKYAGNVERLKKFIRDPVKTNAGYPAMPRLGLQEEEIDAVARYLLTTAGKAK